MISRSPSLVVVLNVIGFVAFWVGFSVMQERLFKAQNFDLPIVATFSHQLVTGALGGVLYQLTDRQRTTTRRIVNPFDLAPLRSKPATLCDSLVERACWVQLTFIAVRVAPMWRWPPCWC